MRTPEEAILKIVEGMIEQILKTLSDNDGKNKTRFAFLFTGQQKKSTIMLPFLNNLTIFVYNMFN
jgi:hypothetical protein